MSVSTCVEDARPYVSVEYCVLGGVNDSEACAEELAELMRGREADVIVNLIPYNPTDVPMGRAPQYIRASVRSAYKRLDQTTTKGSSDVDFSLSFLFFSFLFFHHTGDG